MLFPRGLHQSGHTCHIDSFELRQAAAAHGPCTVNNCIRPVNQLSKASHVFKITGYPLHVHPISSPVNGGGPDKCTDTPTRGGQLFHQSTTHKPRSSGYCNGSMHKS